VDIIGYIVTLPDGKPLTRKGSVVLFTKSRAKSMFNDPKELIRAIFPVVKDELR
jgi:hypothetical protein